MSHTWTFVGGRIEFHNLCNIAHLELWFRLQIIISGRLFSQFHCENIFWLRLVGWWWHTARYGGWMWIISTIWTQAAPSRPPSTLIMMNFMNEKLKIFWKRIFWEHVEKIANDFNFGIDIIGRIFYKLFGMELKVERKSNVFGCKKF